MFGNRRPDLTGVNLIIQGGDPTTSRTRAPAETGINHCSTSHHPNSIKGGCTMNYLQELYVKFLIAVKSEKGQTLVEYALLLVLIAIVVIVMLKGIGSSTNNAFSSVNSSLQPGK
jgi:pilus assembly protein Flp/PilA